MPDNIKKLEEEIKKLDEKKEEAIKNEAYEEAGEVKNSRQRKEKLAKLMHDWEEKEMVHVLMSEKKKLQM